MNEDTPDQRSPAAGSEPIRQLLVGDCNLTLLGTAHVSRSSAEQVAHLIETGGCDAVAVELCASRHRALAEPDSIAKLNLLEVLRSGKAPMVMASLALASYQQRLAEQFDIKPGADMRAAVEGAARRGLPLLLIDREIGITLRRVYRSVPWWRRLYIVSGLLASVLSREKVTEDEIERLKQGDMLESAFAQFADEAQDLFKPLIDERDHYMAARLQQEIAGGDHSNVLAVVGAGHLGGMERYLAATSGAAGSSESPDAVVQRLDRTPPASRWPKVLPWLIVLLVLAGFAIGFSRSSELGWSLLRDWVLINGGLSAAGAVLAAAHPLTVVSAFLAAPLTSLNPTVGAGMVTGAIELFLRKPEVGDFGRLRSDTASARGWWRNRVTRVFLVFLFSSLGSAIGTYVAGFRIFEKLT